MVKDQMLKDGVEFYQSTTIKSFEVIDENNPAAVKVRFARGQSVAEEVEEFDAVLFATGR